MKLSRIRIENFRNFKDLQLDLGDQICIVGENQSGKSNLLFALRLLFDASLPDSLRKLRKEDYWDGIEEPGWTDVIRISADLTDFDSDAKLLGLLGDYLISIEPTVARLVYEFGPAGPATAEPPRSTDYGFIVYGGTNKQSRINYDFRKAVGMEFLPALRDAQADIANWRRSPLRPLLDHVASKMGPEELASLSAAVKDAHDVITNSTEVSDLAKEISEKLLEMVGEKQAWDTKLLLSSPEAERLLRSLRIFIDGGKRGLSDASDGSANVLYIALKSLEIQLKAAEEERLHTIFAIEEPEAHLHPNLQRLVYKEFWQERQTADVSASKQTAILTTHSPHVVSVSPLRSLALLKRSSTIGTTGVSTARLPLSEHDAQDLERYIDVTRAEIAFARGVILVEGVAEQFLVPKIARKLDFDLDEHGVVVAAVMGTNFDVYVQLFSRSGLDIPFVVLTDLDPKSGGGTLGGPRVEKLVQTIIGVDAFDDLSGAEIQQKAIELGLFVNEYTFEIDLYRNGWHETICNAVIELSSNGAAKQRCEALLNAKGRLDDPVQLLKDIGEISKGRFAQRLASKNLPAGCPAYIQSAINYLRPKV